MSTCDHSCHGVAFELWCFRNCGVIDNDWLSWYGTKISVHMQFFYVHTLLIFIHMHIMIIVLSYYNCINNFQPFHPYFKIIIIQFIHYTLLLMNILQITVILIIKYNNNKTIINITIYNSNTNTLQNIKLYSNSFIIPYAYFNLI